MQETVSADGVASVQVHPVRCHGSLRGSGLADSIASMRVTLVVALTHREVQEAVLVDSIASVKVYCFPSRPKR